MYSTMFLRKKQGLKRAFVHKRKGLKRAFVHKRKGCRVGLGELGGDIGIFLRDVVSWKKRSIYK